MYDSEVRQPPLETLGRDLLETSRGRLVVALATPFVCVALYSLFASLEWWPAAVLAVMAFSFFSYGSTSHDLVHRNFGLPGWINDTLLTVIEGLALRSGPAYRVSHLEHHRAFPDPSDAEGSPAHRSLLSSLIEGPIYIARLQVWAWRRTRARERRWIFLESAWAVVFAAAGVMLWPAHPAVAVWGVLVFCGSWVFPFFLVYVQHDPKGENELFQTRAFRGRIIPALLLHHLYHLEHHLYPKVPAHHWRELSRRVSPFLQEAGVKTIRIP